MARRTPDYLILTALTVRPLVSIPSNVVQHFVIGPRQEDHDRSARISGGPFSAMKTLMLLTYISVFLSGVFVSLLISTARLSNGQNYLDLLASGQYDAPRAGGNGTVRGPSGGASTEAELRRQLLAERERADDLQRRVEGLQSGGNGAAGAASSKDSDASFKRRLLDSFLDKRPSDLCSALPEPTPTALSLWSNFQSDVFNSTQHAADQDYTFHDFTARPTPLHDPDVSSGASRRCPWTGRRWGRSAGSGAEEAGRHTG
ncbi:hypothetical protein THAOC_06002, partial [Thalassiosira oceanica]